MLTVDNACFSYGNLQPLFSHVSFKLQAGDILHLRGRNGCGKSTFLKGLVGLLDLCCERILWCQQPEIALLRQHCAYIPCDEPGIFHALTAADNLRFFASLSNQDPHDHEVDELLERWGFCSLYVKKYLQAGLFSTGMKKRLALARMECMKRALWLLDEPTHGLDSTGQQQLQHVLMAHSQQGGMVIIVSHSPHILESIPHHHYHLDQVPTATIPQ